MRIHGKAFKFVLALLALVFLFAVNLSQSSMNRFRAEKKLTHTEQIENLPPALAFTTVVLGGFRGLIANILWVRAMQMQEDGKFFEMAQLGDWITKLQPHADHVAQCPRVARVLRWGFPLACSKGKGTPLNSCSRAAST